VARDAVQRFQNETIVWCTTKPYAALVSEFQAVDQVITVRCLTEWMLLWRTGSFRAVLDLHFSNTCCPKCVIGFPKSGAAAAITGERHYFYGNQLTTRCLCAGQRPIDGGPQIVPDRNSRSKIDSLRLPPAFVVIHCSASEISREWRDEHWLTLADLLVSQFGLEVVEIGLAPRAIRETRAGRWNLCGQLSITETAELIRRARVFIGIDSGPAHLANAVGTQGIILLGKFRDHERYMPFSGPYETAELCDQLWADGPAASLPLETVVAAVERRLSS
jgi:heptosyltransferase-3